MAGRRFLGIPERDLASRRPGLVTKEEVRAIALLKLRLHRDSTVWDIGAGSGSLALEASFVAPQGRVYAVERDEGQVEALRRNLEALGGPNLHLVPGEAPEALRGLPDPDAVFLGGSGGRLGDIVEEVARRLRPGGRVVAPFATLENLESARRALEGRGFSTEVVLVSLARSAPVAGRTRLEALNPVFLLSAWREEVARE